MTPRPTLQPTLRPTLRPLYAAAMAAVGAALISGVVACSPSSEAAPANPGGAGDPFIQCMTDNGGAGSTGRTRWSRWSSRRTRWSSRRTAAVGLAAAGPGRHSSGAPGSGSGSLEHGTAGLPIAGSHTAATLVPEMGRPPSFWFLVGRTGSSGAG